MKGTLYHSFSPHTHLGAMETGSVYNCSVFEVTLKYFFVLKLIKKKKLKKFPNINQKETKKGFIIAALDKCVVIMPKRFFFVKET